MSSTQTTSTEQQPSSHTTARSSSTKKRSDPRSRLFSPAPTRDDASSTTADAPREIDDFASLQPGQSIPPAELNNEDSDEEYDPSTVCDKDVDEWNPYVGDALERPIAIINEAATADRVTNHRYEQSAEVSLRHGRTTLEELHYRTVIEEATALEIQARCARRIQRVWHSPPYAAYSDVQKRVLVRRLENKCRYWVTLCDERTYETEMQMDMLNSRCQRLRQRQVSRAYLSMPLASVPYPSPGVSHRSSRLRTLTTE